MFFAFVASMYFKQTVESLIFGYSTEELIVDASTL